MTTGRLRSIGHRSTKGAESLPRHAESHDAIEERRGWIGRRHGVRSERPRPLDLRALHLLHRTERVIVIDADKLLSALAVEREEYAPADGRGQSPPPRATNLSVAPGALVESNITQRAVVDRSATSASACLESNSQRCDGAGCVFETNVKWAVSLLQDTFDQPNPSINLPNDGSHWMFDGVKLVPHHASNQVSLTEGDTIQLAAPRHPRHLLRMERVGIGPSLQLVLRWPREGAAEERLRPHCVVRDVRVARAR